MKKRRIKAKNVRIGDQVEAKGTGESLLVSKIFERGGEILLKEDATILRARRGRFSPDTFLTLLGR